MKNSFRLATVLCMATLLPGCGMQYGASYGHPFPSDADMEPQLRLHYRAGPTESDSGSGDFGLEFTLYTVEVDGEAGTGVGSNLLYELTDGRFYLFGGAGFVAGSAEPGAPKYTVEAGLGVEHPLLVGRYRDGLYVFAEGAYTIFGRTEMDPVSAPLVRAGVMVIVR